MGYRKNINQRLASTSSPILFTCPNYLDF